MQQQWMMEQQQRQQREQWQNTAPAQPQLRYKTDREVEQEIQARKAQYEAAKAQNARAIPKAKQALWERLQSNSYYAAYAMGENHWNGSKLVGPFFGFNKPVDPNNPRAAQEEALKECRQNGRVNCTVVATFKDRCAILLARNDATTVAEAQFSTYEFPEFDPKNYKETVDKIMPKMKAQCERRYGVGKCEALVQIDNEFDARKFNILPYCSVNRAGPGILDVLNMYYLP